MALGPPPFRPAETWPRLVGGIPVERYEKNELRPENESAAADADDLNANLKYKTFSFYYDETLLMLLTPFLECTKNHKVISSSFSFSDESRLTYTFCDTLSG
jgi:hypothetical protein